MNHSFFAMLSRMKYIDRWALMRNTSKENICEHSYDVAVLAHVLALLTNKRFGGNVNVEVCVLLSIYHDTPEILTGDLPTPVKYDNPVLRDAYQQLESVAANKLLSMLPDDLREDYREWLLPNPDTFAEERRLVKAADKLAALIKCMEEIKQGNREFASARIAAERVLHEMHIPAVDTFLTDFLPSFDLTLDEL